MACMVDGGDNSAKPQAGGKPFHFRLKTILLRMEKNTGWLISTQISPQVPSIFSFFSTSTSHQLLVSPFFCFRESLLHFSRWPTMFVSAVGLILSLVDQLHLSQCLGSYHRSNQGTSIQKTVGCTFATVGRGNVPR